MQRSHLSAARVLNSANDAAGEDGPKSVIQRRTMSRQVADVLRQRILAGEYAPQTQLRQEHIASELGISRIPVREALHQLHSEGFVTLISHRGAVVSSISLDEILELYELRARVETWLVALAIPNMSAADLDLARECAEAFGQQGDDSERSHEANWRFHAALYAPSGRKTTIEIVARIHQQIERYTRMMTSLTGPATKFDQEHRQLIDLCERKDTLRAVALLDMHILDGGRALVSMLKELRGS